MNPVRKTVVFSLYGTSLDRSLQTDGKPDPERWSRWRPTLSLCQQADFVPDRLEVITQSKFRQQCDALLEDVASASPETHTRRHLVPMRDPWDFSDVYAALRDFAEAYPFDEDEEDYYVHITTGTHVAQICLFLLAETRHLPARLIQTSPPRARRRDPSQPGTIAIIDLDLSRYDQLAARFQERRRTGTSFLKEGIETRSPAYNALIERIEQVATASAAPILLTGATGVGKTRLARRIYELKKQQAASSSTLGSFIEVNCATLRGDGAMSALFGHEKGAFTGAAERRAGLLSAADQGVLFLDEIGELGMDEQAMLLRAIEDGVFLPMGSDRPQHSRFQLIAGSNRDLHAAVAAGRFREDLLARIDLWSFELPSLKDRIEDLEPNLEYELARHTKSAGRKVSFNREARQRFLEFAAAPSSTWNANFRDFASAVTRMATLAASDRIHLELVEEEIGRLRQAWDRVPQAGSSRPDPLIPDLLSKLDHDLDHFDLVQLAEVLRICSGSASMSAAGRALFAVSRQRKTSRNDSDRLKKYLARFGLDWAAVHS